MFNFSNAKEVSGHPPLRGFLLEGEFFIGSVLATTLTKLGLRFNKVIIFEILKNYMRKIFFLKFKFRRPIVIEDETRFWLSVCWLWHLFFTWGHQVLPKNKFQMMTLAVYQHVLRWICKVEKNIFEVQILTEDTEVNVKKSIFPYFIWKYAQNFYHTEIVLLSNLSKRTTRNSVI